MYRLLRDARKASSVANCCTSMVIVTYCMGSPECCLDWKQRRLRPASACILPRASRERVHRIYQKSSLSPEASSMTTSMMRNHISGRYLLPTKAPSEPPAPTAISHPGSAAGI